jgi:hypothetical protein
MGCIQGKENQICGRKMSMALDRKCPEPAVSTCATIWRTKLESLATQQPVSSLLVDIVSEYVEVTEFIVLRKEKVRNPNRC